MKIYRNIEGVKTEMHDIPIDLQTELRQSISGEDLISSRFTVEGNKLDLQIGDYVEFKGSQYTILDEPQVKKSQNTFSYNLEFKSDLYILKNVLVLFNGESEFFLFGDAQDVVSLIISNLNRVYSGAAFYADYIEETESRNVSFNGENALAAMQRIAQEFECEFRVIGRQITFRKKIGEETGMVLRYAKELRDIERRPLPNAELVTVLYPQGSNRNITSDYGSNRLRIDPISNNEDIFGTIERSVVFEDIYPRLNGLVSTTSDPDKFQSTSIDFDINDHLIGGETARIVFNSGDLAGREFEISRYRHNTQEVTLIPYTDETDFTWPNETFRPRVGDKFVLLGIKMPQSYIDNAEAELLSRATEYLEKYSQPNVVYNVSPHYPELRRLNIHYNLGDIVTLQDDDFGIEFQTRILSLRQKVARPFEYSIELGHQITVNYLTKVLTDTRNLKNEIYFQGKYQTEQLNRIYNGVKAFSQAVYINRGEFDPDNFYYNNKNRRDFVYRENTEGEKKWWYFTGEDHTKSEWIEANWELIGSDFEIIATQTILADNANIGNWILQNGQLVSQATYQDPNDPDIIAPRAHINGADGSITLISNHTTYSPTGDRNYKQEMKLDSSRGVIEIKRNGDQYQESGRVGITSSGMYAKSEGRGEFGPGAEYVIKATVSGIAEGKYPKEQAGDGFLAGVLGQANNTANNPAPAFGGVFYGLKSFGRYKGVRRLMIQTTYTPTADDEVLTCYQTARLTITLPPTQPGRTIIVKRMSAEVVVVGNIFTNRQENSKTIRMGDTWQFIYDGNYWIANALMHY